MILLFLENGDILVVVLVTLNAVKNPRGHVLSVELRYLEWKHDDGMIIGDCPQKIATILKSWSHIYAPAKTWCPQAYLGRRRNSSAPLCPCSPAWFRCGRLLWSISAMRIMTNMMMSVQCSLVFWVILEYRSTHNGGGKAALLRDQADDWMAIAIRWIGKISVRTVKIARKITTSPHSASSRFSAASMSA